MKFFKKNFLVLACFLLVFFFNAFSISGSSIEPKIKSMTYVYHFYVGDHLPQLPLPVSDANGSSAVIQIREGTNFTVAFEDYYWDGDIPGNITYDNKILIRKKNINSPFTYYYGLRSLDQYRLLEGESIEGNESSDYYTKETNTLSPDNSKFIMFSKHVNNNKTFRDETVIDLSTGWVESHYHEYKNDDSNEKVKIAFAQVGEIIVFADVDANSDFIFLSLMFLPLIAVIRKKKRSLDSPALKVS